jgi:Phage tail tube protein
MAVDIGATGLMGIAFETVYGTYVAPTKYFPILSESLEYKQGTSPRRDIRGTADSLGGLKGYSMVEGDIEAFLFEDMIAYMLQVSRNTVVKTGAGPNYTYTTTPLHGARTTTKTSMSITIVRAGVVFGYTGCLVTGFELTVENSIPQMKYTIIGSDEAVQSAPTPTWPTTTPFVAGQWSIEVPTSTPVTDTTDVKFEVNDNGTPQNRLASSTKAAFVAFGQREVTAELTRDFDGRTEYDAFKALTGASISIVCTKGANNKVTFKLPAAYREEYTVDGLSDQGSLIMAKAKWQGAYDTATSKSYEIVILNQENIT